MRIGIDIDGVLTDIEKFLEDYGTRYSIEEGIELNINKKYYDEGKIFSWTEEETIKFWNKYLVSYCKEYPARDFASEVIKKLKKEGHEIYLVTARNDYGLPEEYIGKMKELVDGWLKNNDIIPDKIIYTEGSKLPYCVGNYIEVMIEDNPEHIEKISEQIPTLCFNADYNSNLEGKNITRVYSWYDIYDKINKMC